MRFREIEAEVEVAKEKEVRGIVNGSWRGRGFLGRGGGDGEGRKHERAHYALVVGDPLGQLGLVGREMGTGESIQKTA